MSLLATGGAGLSEGNEGAGRDGAVGGIPRDEVPLIVTDLVDGMDVDLAIRIRPERIGTRYTVAWNAVDDSWEYDGGPPRISRRIIDIGRWLGRYLHQGLTTVTSLLDASVPTFDVDRPRINLFEVDERYLFKHYFEQEDVFTELQPYYNGDEYRFEVPADAVDEVSETLQEHYFEPVLVQELEPFCVVQTRYSDHPPVLFKASVLERTQGEYHVFLMKDRVSVEQAVQNGAERLADSDLRAPF